VDTMDLHITDDDHCVARGHNTARDTKEHRSILHIPELSHNDHADTRHSGDFSHAASVVGTLQAYK